MLLKTKEVTYLTKTKKQLKYIGNNNNNVYDNLFYTLNQLNLKFVTFLV